MGGEGIGDILSDLAAEAAGGLGIAPSGCFGDRRAYFESVHGSAPDIAGKGIANPTATILSAAMMLEHMGLEAEAERLEATVALVYHDGQRLTPDQGGRATTKEFCQDQGHGGVPGGLPGNLVDPRHGISLSAA